MIRVPEATTEDPNRDPARAVPDLDESRTLEVALDRATAENRQDRHLNGERGPAPEPNVVLLDHAAVDRGRDLNLAVPDLDENRTPGVADAVAHAPDVVTVDRDLSRDVPDLSESRGLGVVQSPAMVRRRWFATDGDTAADKLLLSESHERRHDPCRPNGSRAAVLGLCRNRQVEEVALGRKTSLQLTLAVSNRNVKHSRPRRINEHTK